MCNETVIVEVIIPKKLMFAFDWYLRLTKYWIDNDNAKNSYSDYLKQLLWADLEGQSNGPVHAEDMIKDELKLLMDF